MIRHPLLPLCLTLATLLCTSQPSFSANTDVPSAAVKLQTQAHKGIDMKSLSKSVKSLSDVSINQRAIIYFLLLKPNKNFANTVPSVYADIKKSRQAELIVIGEDDIRNESNLSDLAFPVIEKAALPKALADELLVFGETVVMLNSKGHILDVGDFSLLNNWKKSIAKAKKTSRAKKEKTALPHTEQSQLEELVQNQTYETSSRPNPKAKHYMFLMASRICAACCAAMPDIVKEYESMRKSNQLEIILYGAGGTIESKYYANKYQIPFPVVKGFTPELKAWIKEQKQAANLPKKTLYVPLADLFDHEGKVLAADERATDILNQWDSFTAKSTESSTDKRDSK